MSALAVGRAAAGQVGNIVRGTANVLRRLVSRNRVPRIASRLSTNAQGAAVAAAAGVNQPPPPPPPQQEPDDPEDPPQMSQSLAQELRLSAVDQSEQIQAAATSTNRVLMGVLSQDGPKHCLVDGISQLIEHTAPQFTYLMNEAVLEYVRGNPEIRLIINSHIQDMIAEFVESLTEEERKAITDNMNGECRAAFIHMSAT